MLPGAGVAHDLMPGVSDSRWAARGHHARRDRGRAARDAQGAPRRERSPSSPARALNMVCVVDKAWSGEVANRLRNVGRYHASRTIVLRGRAQAHAARRGGDDRQRHPPEGRASSRCCARRSSSTSASKHLAAPGHDRRPAGRHRPADRAVVAARPSRGRRRPAARSPRSCCSTRSTTPTSATALERARELLEQGLRRRPRVAALDAVARARRGDLRPAAPAPRPAPHQRRHRPPPPGVGGRRRCCSSAGSPRAWAGSRRSSSRATGRWPARPTASARTSTSASSPMPRQSVRGLAGLTLETASGRHLRARPRAGRPARPLSQPQGRRARVDGPRRLARRGRHPRRGHPPGAAARPDVRAGARRGQRAGAVAPARRRRSSGSPTRPPDATS